MPSQFRSEKINIMLVCVTQVLENLKDIKSRISDFRYSAFM